MGGSDSYMPLKNPSLSNGAIVEKEALLFNANLLGPRSENMRFKNCKIILVLNDIF